MIFKTEDEINNQSVLLYGYPLKPGNISKKEIFPEYKHNSK